MSQIFNLRLATDTLATDAQLLNVTPAHLQNINIQVSVSIIQQPEPQLWFTYQIQIPYAELAAQLSWSTWQQAQCHFTDYLWEDTCLECFIAGSSTDSNEATRYIEINASPNGRYALYHFKSYRNQSSLPPLPLLYINKLQTEKKSRAYINWSDNIIEPPLTSKLSPMNTSSLIPVNLKTHSFKPRYCYQRRFGLPISQLPSYFFNDSFSSSVGIEQLHPCVILRFGEIALYFASAHVSPPDFHQRSYWPSFDYQTVMASHKD
ncbi:hypothetical protein [Psychrobacter urativorans]|uniref:Uncharacterized protein n=1 Tax=Psychrobacter urativorans TaxID=45610 RepID=A0A0M4U668_9GAMM|nr:hypothetical protein [Psychrobacter urativorans]ALF59351.1 hypothetical protein AOC03_04200 [Psychrobacter urativorans]